MRCPRCYHETWYHHRCPECGERLLTYLSPRMRRMLEREAAINRRRAWVFLIGLAVGIGAAPFMVNYNPAGAPWLALYSGALASLLLWAWGQLTPYEESYHEFHDTYINAGHNYMWPGYTAYHASVGQGLTNFMVVELGAGVAWAAMCLATNGAMGIQYAMLCFMAAFVAWVLSSSLRLHWY